MKKRYKIKLHSYLLLLTIVFYVSCNQIEKHKITSVKIIDSTEVIPITNVDASPKTLYRLGDEIVFDTTIAINRKETPYKGQVKRKSEWWDLCGLNRFILSSVYNYGKGSGRAEIFAYQYVKNKDKWNIVWQMNDFVDGMGCDLQIKLLHLQLDDIDKNGKPEVILMYTLDNRCDAVFVSTTLLLYENAQKIAIRGVSSQYLMPPEDIFNKQFPEGGYFKYKNIDPGVFPEDTIFVKYASKFWDDFIENENEQYEKDMEEFQRKQKEEAERKKLKRAKKNR